jgi:glycosyltransferase involved in cell wall biosynthesis
MTSTAPNDLDSRRATGPTGPGCPLDEAIRAGDPDARPRVSDRFRRRRGVGRVSAKKHRVAIVADAIYPFRIGGKETTLFEFGRHLAARGHQVDVYTMHWWSASGTFEHEGLVFHSLMPKLPLYTKAGRRSTVQALAFGLATVRLLFRRADVYLVDSIPFFPLFAGRIVASLRRRELVTFWHEYWGRAYWTKYAPRMTALSGAALERLATRCPDRILCNSRHTEERLSRVVKQDRLATVSLGLDLAAIDDVCPSPESWDVISAGRLLEYKRLDLLLEAVCLVKREHPDVRCLIVGSGPERGRLEEMIQRLELDDNVEIRPFFRSVSSLYALIKSSRVFVLPSVREGFGLVVREAHACGTLVVTSDHLDNAARHLIVEGENGLLSAPNSPDLASGIARILNEPSRFLDSVQLREQVSDFDWHQVSVEFERELVASGRGTAVEKLRPVTSDALGLAVE